jgi:transposase
MANYQTNLIDWKAYDLAQTMEGKLFWKLLRELMNQVQFKPRGGKGRPFLYIPDMLFCCGLKLYLRLPARKLISQLELAKQAGYIASVPHFTTINKYFGRREITGVLKELLTLSSKPMKQLEQDFAIDSTGFSTSEYERWFDPNKREYGRRNRFVKAHAMCGVITNVITSLEITMGSGADSLELPKLVAKTSEHFKMREVSADKAYSSRANLTVIDHYGAKPFIPFKSNVTGKAGGSMIWKKMYRLFSENEEEFYKHYHKRSNVESTFSAIKRKYGSRVYTKNLTSQTNELYLKCIAFNISMLIRFMYNRGLDVNFNKSSEGMDLLI